MLFILSVMSILGSCSETVVDESSAKIIGRRIDTIISHDTTTLLDTLLLPDTLYLTDTVVRYDTVIKVVTVVTTDTVFRKDTVRLHDTVKATDTVTLRDTVIRHDTIRDCRGRFSGGGWIYLRPKPDGEIADSVPITFDPASLLEFDNDGGAMPSLMQLRLIARAARPSNWYIWGDRCTWLLYLLVNCENIPQPAVNIRRELLVDPREAGPGLAVVLHPPADARWLATAGAGGEGTFWINRIDVAKRRMYASFKARFSSPEAFAIDSASLRLEY